MRWAAWLARASGSLARSAATVAYCCAQAVRADTSSLAMPPATHIRQAPCFCMSPASQDRQTHRFVMFPGSCIWPNTAFCTVVCKPWTTTFCNGWRFSGFAAWLVASLALLVMLLPVYRIGLRLCPGPLAARMREESNNPNSCCTPHMPDAPFCDVPSRPHPTNTWLYNAA